MSTRCLDAVLGTANNLAVWDTTNDECMPQLLNATGAAQWGDVENHPWTTGMQIDYFSEAQLWKLWLEAEHPDLKKVAMLTFNNDFGKSYAAGLPGGDRGHRHRGRRRAAARADGAEPDEPVHEPGRDATPRCC